MFDDPKKYFRTFRNTVDSCWFIEGESKVLEGPKASPSWEQWQIITVEIHCRFHSGERLEVFEGYTRKNIAKTILHNHSYQFMEASGVPIFRIDTHGLELKVNEPSHLHLGAEETIILDGDARLNGFSLARIDFLRVFAIIFDHLEGREFPWEEA